MSFAILAPTLGLMLGRWWATRKRLYVRKPKIKSMSYEEREEITTGIEARINKKIIDLQDQLLRHYASDDFKLHENDLIRYSAMIEILKTVKQA